MIARAAAAALAALGSVCCAAAALAGGGMIMVITINANNPSPVRPQGPVNNLEQLAAALAACWSPPPLDQGKAPIDLTFQVSFKRSGELFGKPRVVHFAREVTAEERRQYYLAVVEAIDRCAPMPFTDSMGGAVAGRTFRINFQDARNKRRANISWPTMKS